MAAVGSKDYTLQCIASKAAIAGGKGKGSRIVSLHDRFALKSTHTDMLSKAWCSAVASLHLLEIWAPG